MKRAYDQLPNEGPKPYAAFRHFCEQGPERSIVNVTRESQRKPGYRCVLSRWASRFHWHERSAAWDADEYERRREEKAVDDRKERELERRARRVMMQTARNPILRRIAALDKQYRDAEGAGDAKACHEIAAEIGRLIMSVRTLNLESRAEWDEEPTQNVRELPTLTVTGWNGNGDGSGG